MEKSIKLSQIMPVVEEKLKTGGTVEIPIRGTSMLPLLHEGRDTVVLTAVSGRLKKFDLPLYRRENGAFVLHRVIGADEKGYVMCGDNQWVREKGVEDGQLIGLVCEINRNGKKIDVNSFRYKSYCRFWYMLLPVRKYIVKIRGKLGK